MIGEPKEPTDNSAAISDNWARAREHDRAVLTEEEVGRRLSDYIFWSRNETFDDFIASSRSPLAAPLPKLRGRNLQKSGEGSREVHGSRVPAALCDFQERPVSIHEQASCMCHAPS
jgi:hypothetical protein